MLLQILIQPLKSLALHNNKMEGKNLSPAIYPNVVPTSSNNPGKTAVPFAHKDLRKSLEAIVSGAKPKKKSYFFEGMFSDKAKTLKASVSSLLEGIKRREDLNSHQFKIIDGEICRQYTELMSLENIRDCYPGDLTRDVDEARAKIEANVLEFEREKRLKSLECWRDLM
ncbi:MAG: hypothetical protein KAJ18_11950, partial [Candidatus Omnitrophica bacterium]|nr:hypothetical protein [Candidatus Omnitrophota bacterium]